MNIRHAFKRAYEELPLLTDAPEGLRTTAESHRASIMHLPNRGCRRCVGEVAQIVVADAVREGATVAKATQTMFTILTKLGFSTHQIVAMLKNQ